MPRVQWPLRLGRPCVEVALVVPTTGQLCLRMLLADTGAGEHNGLFALVLDESDCLLCTGKWVASLPLRGAYSGPSNVYTMAVRMPALGFADDIPVVGVPTPPPGFDGIAGFGFLNRFTYGNFGDPTQFGLET